MTRPRTLLLIFFQYLCLSGMAQQLNFIRYTAYDGLVANPIRCIFQDSKGFIWIGTIDGLSRYDGYKFTNYSTVNGLSHNYINSINEIEGKVFVAENDGSIDVFENNHISNRFKAASAINVIHRQHDQLLFSSDSSGFYIFKNGTFRLARQKKNAHAMGAMLPLGKSVLLATGLDHYLFVYKNDLSNYTMTKNLNAFSYNLFEDSKKRIWICTSNGLKLLSINLVGDSAITFFSPLPPPFDIDLLKSVQVTSILEDKDGSFWIGTLKGLVHLFPDGSYHIYDEKDGLPSARIQSLYSDKEKNLWIGTSLGLIKWVSANNVAFFNTETQDFSNDIIVMPASGKHRIILKTDPGIQEFNLEKRKFETVYVPGGNSFPVPIAGSSPLLIHYADKIGVLDHHSRKVTPALTLDSIVAGVISAVQHPDKSIFLTTFTGLYVLNKQSIKRILPFRLTSLVIDAEGNVWTGAWTSGLFRISVKNSQEGLYDVTDMTSLVKEKMIRGLYADSRKNIWVGTRYGGAYCLSPKGPNDFEVQHFSRQSGLISDWVISFAETNTGDIWVGTYLGLDKLVKRPGGYRVFNFSKAVNYFAEIKKIVAVNGYWICLENTRMAIFKDEGLHKAAPLQPIIFSSSLGLLDDKLTIDLPIEKISLKPRQNAARFEFGALGFMNERQVLYSYRLKGSGDTSWSKPENLHEASYASLAPGNYTFEVKALGWNGEYSAPASFSFFISTPFWKQWWFIALCALVLAGIFYTLYRYRINELLRMQRVRNNIATDLHDDIGSSLTNISILSELSSKNISVPEKAQSFLQRISEEVQASSQAMDDIIWSVNSRNDSLQETLARMRRYAAELFDNSDINCYMQLDEKAGDKKLSMEQRRDVYLIYKEALNNIHKHAEARNIWINVGQSQNHLLVHIKDDGKGFKTNMITHRNGLINLRSRVDKWNGKIKIESETDKGTNISIKIPLRD